MKRRLTSAAVASVAVGLAARRFRADLARADHRLAHPAVRPKQLRTSAGLVRYVDLGSGDPVLVLHGNLGGWDQVVDWAGRRLGPGFRVIGPSRFGYPGSSLPPYADVAQQADVLIELLDRIGLDRVAVVSISAGSITAARLAAQYPDRVRALVMESPVLPTAKPLRQPPARVCRALTRSEPISWLIAALPAVVAAASGVPWHRLSPAERTELRAIVQSTTPASPRADGVFFDTMVAYREIVQDSLPWEKIETPTLIVAAHDSPLPTPGDTAALLQRLSRGQLLEVPTGGHLILGNVARLRFGIESFLGNHR